MKAFVRKIRSVKKRKLLKNLVGTVTAAAYFRYGAMQDNTEPSPFFVNYDRSNQRLERPHPYLNTIIVNDEIESLPTQKSELTYSQEELDALGLGKVNSEVTSVVGLPLTHSSRPTLAVHEENWIIQES